MTTTTRRRHALVFGATGFLGRHLVLTLLADGVAVTAACRTVASFDRLAAWVARHGSAAQPRMLHVRFDAPELGVERLDELETVTEVHNCAGAYRFGMSVEEARAANVESVRAIVALATRLSLVDRVVHVSGYRVGGQDAASVPWDAARVARTYRQLGAYEASKVEADAVFQAVVGKTRLSWTIVNPSSISGASTTGESDQYLGLAASFRELWNGTLAALPGNAETFVPVVPVDHVARFMARLPIDPTTAGRSYWVLDDATPALPELLAMVARHYQVRVPAFRVPVALVKHLPRALTKADPETVGFLSSDRYPVHDADELAARYDLRLPDTAPAILRWADHLAAHRFGEIDAARSARGFAEVAEVRTFRIGPTRPGAVVLPGLPVNADVWQPAAPADALVVDLPGLGMSSGDLDVWPRWLDALVIDSGVRHLIGHSIGAAAAVEAARRLGDRVDTLTLVAPFFLQAPPGPLARATLLTRCYLRRVRPEDLSERLTGSRHHADALQGVVADLRRAGTAGRVARLLAQAARSAWRRALVAQLVELPVRVHVIVGSRDPLAPWAAEALTGMGDRGRITIIDGAGHHPELTHPELVAATISAGSHHAGASSPSSPRELARTRAVSSYAGAE
jgi:nucleoside-diphosphate-sugar epimerase/pimeloyl-ACP methyl ester carboxylesterase